MHEPEPICVPDDVINARMHGNLDNEQTGLI